MEVLAAQQKHVVVTCPVSSIAGVESLWLGFRCALSDAAEKAGLLKSDDLPYRRLETAVSLDKGRHMIGAGMEAAGAGLSWLTGIPAVGNLVKGVATLGTAVLSKMIGIDAETGGTSATGSAPIAA